MAAAVRRTFGHDRVAALRLNDQHSEDVWSSS